MKIIQTYSLKEDQKKEIKNLAKSVKFQSLYQDVEWVSLIEPSKKTNNFLIYSNNNIVTYALVLESFFSANIQFGPLSISNNGIIKCIENIKIFYKKKNFGLLTLQFPYPISNDSEYIDYSLFKGNRFSQGLNYKNWTTIFVDLTKDIDEIYRNFSKGHKSTIKKASKEGISACIINDEKEILAFSKIFKQLYEFRKIKNTFHDFDSTFLKINKYLTTNKAGYFIGIKNKDNIVLGGIVICKEGNRMLYKYGAASNNFKINGILHSAILEAIKISKSEGLKYFDLGGYEFLAKEKSQVFFINRFKSGFSKNYIFYSRKVEFRLNLFSYYFIKLLRFFFEKLKL